MPGAQKLADHLRKTGMTQLEFAELAGVPGPQVSMWLSGRRRPGLESAFKIERATGGKVRATDWLPKTTSAKHA